MKDQYKLQGNKGYCKPARQSASEFDTNLVRLQEPESHQSINFIENMCLRTPFVMH